MIFSSQMRLFDLNYILPVGHTSAAPWKEAPYHEHRQNGFCSDHQLCSIISITTVRRSLQRQIQDDKFTCREQFLYMSFAQLTYHQSLRDIKACLRVAKSKMYHLGIRSIRVAKQSAHANETRDWKIYADFKRWILWSAIKSATTLFIVTESPQDIPWVIRCDHTRIKCTTIRQTYSYLICY